MINLNKPICFFDDTNKSHDYLILDKIIFEGKDVCICTIHFSDTQIVFDKNNGVVLNKNYSFWYAKNPIEK